ncbi:Tubulin like [Halorientalis persicus]|uniref:Tubulin like n=1 Tax=Halorientalis persicus TaxID=1367881 RepID=A0A1H8WFG6_9EURY|nr:tubulin-like doman-containing protein [Halorientalis persicus]SEP25858.1 Tubulin like [Halorientalis persicus]
MVTNPSIVIGIGEAGCKMAARTYESIKDEVAADRGDPQEVLDRFKFVGIDTKADEVEEYTPESFQTIALETPTKNWENDVEEFPYLREDMQLADVGGATRQRAVSRYYIDNLQNYKSFRQQLERVVEEFEDDAGKALDDPDIEGANLWIVNSFGGGTGSGAFPLIAGMLDQITDDADENYYLCGLGSLPRLDQLDDQSRPPAANENFYANAYTALRELSVLLDYDFVDEFTDAAGTDFPIEIPLYATHGENQLPGYNDIRLEEPPFDFYGLIGFNEEKGDNTDYRQNLNQVASDTIRLLAEEFEEDFPNDYSRSGTTGKPTLYSVDSRGVEVPVSAVENYVQALEDIQNIEDRIEDKHGELERYQENRNYINQVLDIEPGTDPYEEESEGDLDDEEILVDRSIITTAQDHAYDEIDPRSGYDDELLDERYEKALSQVGQLSNKYEFDVEDVFAYLYYRELVSRFRSLKEGHQFAKLVQDAVEDYSDKFSRYLDSDQTELLTASDEAPRDKWTGGLEEWFEEAIEDQEEKLEETSRIKFRVRSEIESRIETLRSRKNELTDEYAEYKRIDDAQNTARGRRNEARTSLEDIRDEINDGIRSTESDLEQLQEEKGRRENVQRSRRETLESYERERYVSIPFQNFENASVEFLTDLESIGDLLEREIVSEQRVARALEFTLENLEEPFQDLEPQNVPINAYRYLGVLTSESNVGILQGDLDGVEGIDKIPTLMSTNSDEQETAIIDDVFRIRFTATNADIALENSSEFAQIHEQFRSEEDVGELLGSTASDAELIGRKFGYPEFFPDDDQVSDAWDFEKELTEPAED